MRPASLKHLLTKPALLIAAGLVLLGAAAGRAAPSNGLVAQDGERTCRASKPSLDVLCRCLSASLGSEDEGGLAHVGLHAALDPLGVVSVEAGRVCRGRVDDWREAPRSRLRQCAVGPSPPRACGAGA